MTALALAQSSRRNEDNDLKTKLPRKHQVKVLLNDVELKYLDSLIGVIGTTSFRIPKSSTYKRKRESAQRL